MPSLSWLFFRSGLALLPGAAAVALAQFPPAELGPLEVLLVPGPVVVGGAAQHPSPPDAALGAPPPEAFRVLDETVAGPHITPYLRLQLDRAWAFDEKRRTRFAAVRTEADVRALQAELRRALLATIGGLPTQRGPLNARIVGTIPREGYRIEKLVFESLPGVHVTALVYVPSAAPGTLARHPAVLLAAGHSPIGKAYPPYQEIAARLALRGYVVLSWDPVGQGERSQFWDPAAGKSRYNLVCGEHAVLGNLATLAGLGIGRYFVWDGMRAVDYLLTRDDVDASRLSITGTSGGGFQSLWIGALDDRVSVVAPSCFPTALPMRMANRIFEDPDSDPEQDPVGLVSSGVDHPGLLLLSFPKPMHVSAAVKDFFPIEGTRKTVREVAEVYRRFGRGDRLVLAEGYHDHQYSPENQESAFAFLDRWNGRPVQRGLPAVTTLPDEALRCTPSGQVRVDLPGRSLVEVVREDGARRPGPPLDLKQLYRAPGAPDVRRWRFVPYDEARGLEPETLAFALTGSSTFGDVVVDRYRLHHSGRLVLPVVHFHSRSGRTERAAVDFGLDGKAGPAEWPQVLAHLKQGREVLTFDPRGLGETRMRYRATSVDDPSLAPASEEEAYANPLSGVLANYVYNAQLLGRPYVLEMVEDVEIVARFGREQLGVRRLALLGRDDLRAVAALGAMLLPDFELLTGGDLGFWAESLDRGRETWPIPLLLPAGAALEPSR